MSEIESKVKAIIVDKLGVDEAEVKPEASFTNDLGADSLDTVELIMEFEKEFSISIPDDKAEKIATVGDAISLSGVFSLTGWSRQIHAEFLVLRATQDTTMLRQHSNTQLSCSMVFLSRKFFSDVFMQRRSPTTPPMP